MGEREVECSTLTVLSNLKNDDQDQTKKVPQSQIFHTTQWIGDLYEIRKSEKMECSTLTVLSNLKIDEKITSELDKKSTSELNVSYHTSLQHSNGRIKTRRG